MIKRCQSFASSCECFPIISFEHMLMEREFEAAMSGSGVGLEGSEWRRLSAASQEGLLC